MHARHWLTPRCLALYFLWPGLALAAPFAHGATGGSDNVSALDAATHLMVAAATVGGAPTALERFKRPEAVSAAPANYQGLWWNSPRGFGGGLGDQRHPSG